MALATFGGIILIALAGGIIVSCRATEGVSTHTPDTGGSPRTPTLPPPPRSGRTIRVRLAAGVAEAQLGASGPVRLLADGEPVNISNRELSANPLMRHGEQWAIGGRRFTGRTLRLEPEAGALVSHAKRPYRGVLIIRQSSSEPTCFNVDNHVDRESYVAGVLARELFRNWHQETYNALAVAARTYATYEVQHAGRRRDFDVYATQASQVYGGASDETAKSIAAVRTTSGKVLACGPDGAERIFKTYYSSCCGGVTNPADGLEPQRPSVRALAGGVVCNDCRNSSRYRWSPVIIPKADVYAALAGRYRNIAEFGGLALLATKTATEWGRPQWVRVTGLNGKSTQVRADDIRLVLLWSGSARAKRLYSMNCHIRDVGHSIVFENGAGFGHGVGLCQYGAQGKAMRGLTYPEILYAYYPGAKIMQAN